MYVLSVARVSLGRRDRFFFSERRNIVGASVLQSGDTLWIDQHLTVFPNDQGCADSFRRGSSMGSSSSSSSLLLWSWFAESIPFVASCSTVVGRVILMDVCCVFFHNSYIVIVVGEGMTSNATAAATTPHSSRSVTTLLVLVVFLIKEERQHRTTIPIQRRRQYGIRLVVGEEYPWRGGILSS